MCVFEEVALLVIFVAIKKFIIDYEGNVEVSALIYMLVNA